MFGFDFSFIFALLTTWLQSLFGSIGLGTLSRIFGVACVTLMLTGCGVEGLHAAKPVTTFEYGASGVKLYDSKDNDISFDELTVSPQTKSGTVKNFVLRNNASDVRNANVNQMAGMAMQATANWNGAIQLTQQLTNLLHEVMPYVPQAIAAKALGKLRGPTSINTPWGGGQFGGVDSSVVDGLLSIAGTAAGSRPAQ